MEHDSFVVCYCCTEEHYPGYYDTTQKMILNLERFLNFLDNDVVIQAMLRHDKCRKFADRFLIAVVFKYFIRMDIHPACYHRGHFFTALHIAHDIYEEANEKIRHQLNMWTLGSNHKLYVKEFTRSKWEFLVELNFKTRVCETWCTKLFSMVPGHLIWKRVREEGHGGVVRKILKQINGEDRYVRDPGSCCRCQNRAVGSIEPTPPPSPSPPPSPPTPPLPPSPPPATPPAAGNGTM